VNEWRGLSLREGADALDTRAIAEEAAGEFDEAEESRLLAAELRRVADWMDAAPEAEALVAAMALDAASPIVRIGAAS
jgi:hypothetical protein